MRYPSPPKLFLRSFRLRCTQLFFELLSNLFAGEWLTTQAYSSIELIQPVSSLRFVDSIFFLLFLQSPNYIDPCGFHRLQCYRQPGNGQHDNWCDYKICPAQLDPFSKSI
jgi:hypothetical protein